MGVPIRENRWYLLSDIVGSVDPSSDKYRKWRREVDAKSLRLKHDLGLRTTPLQLEEHGGNLSFRVSSLAGTLDILDTKVEVLPKFVSTEVYPEGWQQSILLMLNRGRRKQYTYSRLSDLARKRLSFIDHIALAYSDALQRALRGEAIHVYQVREEVAPFLRGRLSVRNQLRSLLSSPNRIHCEVDYLETDNQFNRLLHWAGNRFRTLVLDNNVRRQLSGALAELPPVALPVTLPTQLPLATPPQYKHFSEAIEIASLLARGYGYGHEAGRSSGYGYVVNMEKVFEGFVERSLYHVIPY